MLTQPPVPLRSTRSRSLLAALFVALLGLATLAVDALQPLPSGAQATERTIEMTSAVPDRGYWLPGDPTIDFAITCLEGERRLSTGTDEISGYGWGGSGGFGLGIDPWVAEGTYEIEIACVRGDEPEVMESRTFSIEIGAYTSLEATVGLVSGECATTSEITVEPGTEVFWCYTLSPHPDLTSDGILGWYEAEHSLTDSLNGSLGTVRHDDLLPIRGGLSSVQLGFESSTVVDATVTNTGTWSSTLIDDRSDGARFYPMPVREASARVLVDEVGSTVTTVPGTPSDDDDTAPSPTTDGAAGQATAATPVAAQPSYTG